MSVNSANAPSVTMNPHPMATGRHERFCTGAFLKTALLTAQRSGKLFAMRWDDVDANGVWHIPREAREKQTAGDVKPPPVGLATIDSQPRLVGDDPVFRRPNGATVDSFRQRPACRIGSTTICAAPREAC